MSFSPQWKRRLLIIVLAAVLLAGYTWAFHNVVTARTQGANDFFPRYAAARLVFDEGANPYTPEATDWIQEQLYGDKDWTVDNFHSFAYPLYTILFIAPYLLLPTYAWVQAAWQVTLQVMLLVTLFLMLRYFGWHPSRLMLGVVVLFSVLMFPSARALILGQFSVVVFFLTVLAFWLLFHGEPSTWRDVAAGVCLALSTVKPQMQFLIIPLLVLWALRVRRWHFLGSAALSMAVLFGVSFLMLPTWLGDWLNQVTDYTVYTPPSVPAILTHEVTTLGSGVMWGLRLLLAGTLLAAWWQWLRSGDPRRRDWTLAVTLVITHLLAPRTATSHYIVFLFALVPILRDWEARHRAIPVIAVVILLVGDWWLFIASLQGRTAVNVSFVPLPFIMLALLLVPAIRERFAQQSSDRMLAQSQS